MSCAGKGGLRPGGVLDTKKGGAKTHPSGKEACPSTHGTGVI